MRVFITGGSGFIGTRVVEEILRVFPNVNVLNIDRESPKLASHLPYWHRGDLLDSSTFIDAVREFRPTHAIHMAARTDSDARTLDDYRINIEGSANFIKAIKAAGSVERAIYYSTQYVVRAGPLPLSDRESAGKSIWRKQEPDGGTRPPRQRPSRHLDHRSAHKCVGSMASPLSAGVLEGSEEGAVLSSWRRGGGAHMGMLATWPNIP